MPLNHNGNSNFSQRKGPRLNDFNAKSNLPATNTFSPANNRQSPRPSHPFRSGNFPRHPQQRKHERPKVNPKLLQNGHIADNLLSMQREQNRSRLNGTYHNRQQERKDDDDEKYGNNNNNTNHTNFYSSMWLFVLLRILCNKNMFK